MEVLVVLSAEGPHRATVTPWVTGDGSVVMKLRPDQVAAMGEDQTAVWSAKRDGAQFKLVTRFANDKTPPREFDDVPF